MPQDYDVEWAANRLEWWIITAEGLLATKPTTSSGLIKERHTSPLREREDQTSQIVARVMGQKSLPNLILIVGGSGYAEITSGLATVKIALGKVRTEAETREHLGTSAPAMAADSLHPTVWAAASPLWSSEHYRQAVQTAATVLNADVQKRVGRRDVSDQSLMTEVFRDGAPQPGKPRLRWPGEDTDQTVKAMRDGIRAFAQGCFMAIRNPSTHGTDEMPRQEAFEQLASLSTLARWIDQCQLLPHEDDAQS
ncbi:TIGR02391 family protein [Isoptericola variabilis]|uniref:TIGR02391 family protein n=1 Tax=Isoptericola variabilis TaxID=139208 RepID=UPI003D21CFF1